MGSSRTPKPFEFKTHPLLGKLLFTRKEIRAIVQLSYSELLKLEKQKVFEGQRQADRKTVYYTLAEVEKLIAYLEQSS